MQSRVLGLLLSSLLASLSGCSRGSAARTLFVREGATGDGSSWSAAFGDLQEALMKAAPGDEIWIASGRYRPAGPGASRESTFMLVEGVTMRGGFAGSELTPAERNEQNAPTILDGDLAGDDGPGFTNRTDNCYHVLTAHMLEATTLERVTVRGGHADGPALGAHVESGDQGSGLNVYHSHPHVMDCRFVDNWSANHGAINDHGGGTYEDCVFSANHSEALGAGLYFHTDVQAHAYRCRFFDNHTLGQGGGAYSRSVLHSSFEDCTFIGNGAERGAGLYMADGSLTDLSGSEFLDNVADVGGGGLFIENGGGSVRECAFTHNAAGHDVQGGGAGAGGSGGGGIWISAGAPTVEDCSFDSDSASFGGGIYHSDISHAAVRRCDFIGCSAFEAGGVYALHSPITVEDCLFVGNMASGGAFSVGGGLSIYFAAAHVQRCRFVNNSAELGGGGAYTEGDAPTLERCEFEGNRAFGANQGWGGAYMAGYFTGARVANCSFQGNHARRGGAIFAIAFAAPVLVGDTLAGNSADQDGGGLLAYDSSSVALQNSILWGNLPEELAGNLATLEHCCVRGGSLGGLGNISTDPLFVLAPAAGNDGLWATEDDQRGNLRLAPGSPCRDAGDNALLTDDEQLDLDGEARRIDDTSMPDSGSGDAPVVDLGAYEGFSLP